MNEAEALEKLSEFLKKASPEECLNVIDSLCAERPELRTSLLEVLQKLQS